MADLTDEKLGAVVLSTMISIGALEDREWVFGGLFLVCAIWGLIIVLRPGLRARMAEAYRQQAEGQGNEADSR